MLLNLKKVLLLIFSINLCNFVYSSIIDDKCYEFYSKFGIHINNLQIEVCEEIGEITVPSLKGELPAGFHLQINNKNGSMLFLDFLSLKNNPNEPLIDRKTPVVILWEEMKNDTISFKSNITNVDEFSPNLRDFFIYQNTKNNTVVTLYNYTSHTVVEGMVGDYVVRYFENNMKHYWIKVTYPYERMPFNWASLGVKQEEKLNILDFNMKTSLKTVYLSTTVILDNISVDKKSPDQVIRDINIYFNAVNMLYSNFTNPMIKLIIKTLVVPITVYGREYDQYKPLKLIKNEGSFWQDPQIVLNMVTTPFCDNVDKGICLNHSKTVSFRLYCQIQEPMMRSPAIFQVRHMDFHGGYEKTAQVVALALNASWLSYTDNCTGIMANYLDPPYLPRQWSRCTIKKMSDYFKSVDTSCFRNNPAIEL